MRKIFHLEINVKSIADGGALMHTNILNNKRNDKTRNGTNDRGDALLIHQYVSKLSQP